MSDDMNFTTATFGTSNMLPVPGEEVNALWGRKIAQNAAYERNHSKIIFNESLHGFVNAISAEDRHLMFVFPKEQFINNIMVYYSWETHDTSGFDGTLWINGTIKANVDFGPPALGIGSYSFDISSVPAGSLVIGTIFLRINPNSANGGSGRINLTGVAVPS